MPRTATPPQIAAQFRVLALYTHPERNKTNGQLAVATYAFSEICEAYEVLSSPELKDIYDKFGEQLMKQGVPDKKLVFKGGYKFHGNSFDIFEKFFGTSNPFTVALDAHGDMIGQQQTASTTSMMDAFKKRFTNLYITV